MSALKAFTRRSALGFALLALSAAGARAEKFANQFVEFEVPPQWQCSLEGAEWVCQNTQEAKKKEAIIVLAAKIKGDQDSLDQYLSYLKSPKTYTAVNGKAVKSEPKYAKAININGHPWIDALHLESEIPGFYTRYLATIKQDIGALVTYSINKDKYQEYLKDFETLVNTLKVFRKAGGINAGPASGNIFDQAQIPKSLSESAVFPPVNIQDDEQAPAPASRGGDDMMFYLMVAGGFLVAVALLKKFKKRE